MKNTKSCCLKIVQLVDSLKVLAFFIESDWLKLFHKLSEYVVIKT